MLAISYHRCKRQGISVLPTGGVLHEYVVNILSLMVSVRNVSLEGVVRKVTEFLVSVTAIISFMVMLAKASHLLAASRKNE